MTMGSRSLNNTTNKKRLYKWTVLSKTRKENRRFSMRTAALKHAVADEAGNSLSTTGRTRKTELKFQQGRLRPEN